jgi:hypothetical protein
MGEKEKTKPYQTPQKHPNFSKLFSKAWFPLQILYFVLDYNIKMSW